MATMNATFTERRVVADRRSEGTNALRTGTHTGMNAIDWVALTLMIVGGINWGLVGLFDFNLVAAIFGDMTPLSRVVYVAVGLSALYSIYTATKMSRR
ncbi:MAG TPA: DUF378 domain-containing protein [Burkholderiales bacterium]